MSHSFSSAAGPQALGYLYQAQYALYALLTADGEESALILEGLDDVELQSATATELQQLKHHLSTKRQAVLSNRSTDWWKTLPVCGDLQQQQWDPLRTRLALITTATAAPHPTLVLNTSGCRRYSRMQRAVRLTRASIYTSR